MLLSGQLTGEGDRANNGYLYVNIAESAKNDNSGRSIDGQTVNMAIQDGAGAGNRTAATFVLSGNGEIAPMIASGQNFRTALFLKAYMNANEGGTALDPLGNWFGLGVIAKIAGNGCHAESCIGAEINVLVEPTSTARDVAGLQVISINAHGVKGSRTDAGIVIANQGTVTAKWDHGIAFGRAGANFPVDGTLIGSYASEDARACVNGIDFSSVSFTGYAFRSTGFSVNGAGAVRASSLELFTGSLPINAGGLFRLAPTSTGPRMQRNTAAGGDFSSASTVFHISAADFFGLGITDPSHLLDIGGDSFRLRTAKTPASATAAGSQGQIAWDANYVYVCVATNTWKRVAIATW